jgi:hypothetical protein
VAPDIVSIRLHHGKAAGVILGRAASLQGDQVARMLDKSVLNQWESVIDRRSIDRTLVVKAAQLLFGEEAGAHRCTVRDVTYRGAGIYAPALKVVPLDFALSFVNSRTVRSCRLIWRHGDFLGVAFAN